MTQEEKQPLLIDLCARLPYDLWVGYNGNDYVATGYGHGRVSLLPSVFSSVGGPYPLVEEVKPYLRPMSSMTEEEKKEVSILLNYEFYIDDDYALVAEDERHRVRLDLIQAYTDWLNAHHFDYRGLIEKGLALEAKEGMYD